MCDERDRGINKQAERQTDKQTHRVTNRFYCSKQTDRKNLRYKYEKTVRLKDEKAER